ncbi:MAG: 4'-phosphopantetheinyl transferase superfamily protein [Planctomycetes bacterium]|nr:4'-phosphopantetheinyl transferase superfamily protein [Planctomycetota bacterium]
MEIKRLWESPPTVLDLRCDEVHVWKVSLNLPEWQVRELGCPLSPDEGIRAKRFVFEKHRRRFVVCRGFLRKILSRYLNLEPAQLEFSYSTRGKPEIASQCQVGEIRFNVSNSNEMALFAVVRNRSIGVDVEHINRKREVGELAKRFFFPKESTFINSLSPSMKHEEFFKAWTVKEAYLKATGEGLAGLGQVEVSLSTGKNAELLNIQGGSRERTGWFTHQMKPAKEYVAALVIEGYGCCLDNFRYYCITQ